MSVVYLLYLYYECGVSAISIIWVWCNCYTYTVSVVYLQYLCILWVWWISHILYNYKLYTFFLYNLFIDFSIIKYNTIYYDTVCILFEEHWPKRETKLSACSPALWLWEWARGASDKDSVAAGSFCVWFVGQRFRRPHNTWARVSACTHLTCA